MGLIPWGVIVYTASGGLQATFLASYIHTVIIFFVLILMIFTVYVKVYSTDQIYAFLDQTIGYSEEQCQAIFSDDGTIETTFYEQGKYACGKVQNNYNGSYLTMLSADGLMFGIINIVGNFGTVFVDQSYWQSAIAARPASAARGYLLGGLCWFAIPFSLATSLGLTSTAFLFFCFSANILVTSMLLLGGAATVQALTGMDYRLASFLGRTRLCLVETWWQFYPRVLSTIFTPSLLILKTTTLLSWTRR